MQNDGKPRGIHTVGRGIRHAFVSLPSAIASLKKKNFYQTVAVVVRIPPSPPTHIDNSLPPPPTTSTQSQLRHKDSTLFFFTYFFFFAFSYLLSSYVWLGPTTKFLYIRIGRHVSRPAGSRGGVWSRGKGNRRGRTTDLRDTGAEVKAKMTTATAGGNRLCPGQRNKERGALDPERRACGILNFGQLLPHTHTHTHVALSLYKYIYIRTCGVLQRRRRGAVAGEERVDFVHARRPRRRRRWRAAGKRAAGVVL